MQPKPGRELKEFNYLYREMDGIYHQLALRAGLPDSAFYILYCIVEFGDDCLQRDIADHYHISKQTVNSSIKNLETKGFLTLTRGKGRDMHLRLTTAGQEFAEKYILPVFEAENRIFAEMSPEETRSLLALTAKYTGLLRKNTGQLLDSNQKTEDTHT